MSSFGHLDVIVLALMLVYLLAVVIHVCCRYYAVQRARGIDSADRRTLAAILNTEVGSLKSIAITAPYLGLVGTCEGILSAFGGVGMEKHAALVLITTRMAIALSPTAAGMALAVLAACSYNYLRTRIDLIGARSLYEGPQSGLHFRRAHRFSAARRFAEIPAFGLIAAPVLAMAIMGYTTFASFHASTGFYVELASAKCEYDVVDRLVVLHITDAGKLFLNQEHEDWNSLAHRLSDIYSVRADRTLYLLADSGVPFQSVATALDTVENASAPVGPPAVGMTKEKLGIKVRLITPNALNPGCYQSLESQRLGSP